jgi:hypothetical protein
MRYLVIVTATLAVYLLVGCAGHYESALHTNPYLAHQPEPGTDFDPADFPAELPQDSEAGAPSSPRGTSMEFALHLPASEVYLRTEGNTAVGDPPEFLEFGPGPGEPAWAIYQFTNLGVANQPFVIMAELLDPLPQTIFLGIADYETGHWQ